MSSKTIWKSRKLFTFSAAMSYLVKEKIKQCLKEHFVLEKYKRRKTFVNARELVRDSKGMNSPFFEGSVP